MILDYVLAETLNGLMTHAGNDAATDFLDQIEENTQLHIDSHTGDAFATGKTSSGVTSGFPSSTPASSPTCRLKDLATLYAFDDDFDAAKDVYRLDTPTNQVTEKHPVGNTRRENRRRESNS